MGERASWTETLEDGVSHLSTAFLEYLPQVAGAILLLLAGWAVAALLRMATVRATRGLGWFLPRILPGAAGVRSRGVLRPGLLGGVVFWVTILAFVAAAAQVLGLAVFTSWLDAVFGHLPLIALAGLILIAGVVVSQLVREAVIGAAAAAGLEYRALLGHAAQAAVVVAAAVIGLDLVGLDITFLVVLAGILIGAISGGAALAFGLGSRTLVSNLLGVRAIGHRLREGDAIRIDGIEGRVVELGRRNIVLETAEGRVTVPGRYFSEHPCTLLMREDDRG
ncbi:mechanosensitive ion channel domain-containing protein [Salinisphaera sp. PC39]|uniref:mechanosensitive ion channel family protein n=1 Tax=Salinisphaera sp. PC39 TaxID=1304156 RepID=UPI003341A347